MEYSEKMRQHEKRRRAAKRLRANGWTLKRIGEKYGVTPQRVYQWMRQ